MAKVKKGAKPLTEADVFEEIAKRLGSDFIPSAIIKRLASDGELSHNDSVTVIRTVVRGLKDEMIDCIVQGYKVSLTGLASFEPVVKAGRKKGTEVRNPFKPDEPPKVLRADEPDKFALKISKSPAVGAKFPTLKSSAGKELHDLLYVAPKKKR